jgi:nicotinamidase-related amidase
MSNSANTRFTDRLTRENAAVMIIDHQVGLYTGVRDITLQDLKHNVVGLVKAAKVFGLPIVATTTAAESMWGPMIPEVLDVLPDGVKLIDRSTVNAWDDARVVEAVRATGRTRLVMAAVSTEICGAFPAMSATADGFTAYVAVDASGTFWTTKRDTGLLRMQQAGVIPTDYCTAMIEILADNADPIAGDVYAALGMPFATLVGQLAGAYAAKS